MAFNPYMNNMYNPQNIDNLYQQYQQLQNQLNQSQYNSNTQPNNAVNNRGDYISVQDYNQVETTPARTDGVATLFFDFNNKIFYSKKLLNGKPSIQTFSFDFLNGQINDNSNPTEQQDNKTEKTQDFDTQEVLTQIVNKLDRFDKRIKKLEKAKKEGKEEL